MHMAVLRIHHIRAQHVFTPCLHNRALVPSVVQKQDRIACFGHHLKPAKIGGAALKILIQIHQQG